MGKLLAGAAKRCITPPKDIFDRVNAESDKYNYDGIAGDVYVRVIVLSDGQRKVPIIVCDLSVLPVAYPMTLQLQEKYGIDPVDCVIGSTRNHNGFTIRAAQDRNTFDNIGEGMAEYARFVHKKTIECVGEAIERLVPARIGAKVGQSGINCYRDTKTPVGTLEQPNHSGPRYTDLTVIRVEDLDGNTLAILANYAMHSFFLAHNQFNGTYNYFCADFAGEVNRFVEKVGREQYPVMWASGGCCDQVPTVHSNVQYCKVNDNGEFEYVYEVLPIEGSLMLMRQLVSEHSLDIIKTAESIDNYSEEFSVFSAETFRDVPSRVQFTKYAAPRQMPGETVEIRPLETPLPFRFRLTVINGIAFACSNGEVYSSVCKKVKKIISAPITAMFDLSFGSITSVPDAETEAEGMLGRGYWGCSCVTAKAGEDAYIEAFMELNRKYEDYLRESGHDVAKERMVWHSSE